MRMHNPPHPGSILMTEFMEVLQLSELDAAVKLDFSVLALHDVLHSHKAITADLAVRLEKVFGLTAKMWLNMQAEHDLWQAEQREDLAHLERCYQAEPTEQLEATI